MGLLLEALDVAGPWRWRWLLTDEASGAALADHTVAVDPADEPEAAGFEDLPGFLRWRADPTRRVESEAELVAQVGATMRNAFHDGFERAPECERVVIHIELLVFEPHGTDAVAPRVNSSPKVAGREGP